MRFATLLTLSLLFLAGCVRSLHPVLQNDQVLLDPAVNGVWISEDGKQSFDASPDVEGKHYAVLYRDEDGKAGRFVVRLGKVGELLVAEVQPDELSPASSDIYRSHFLPLYSFLLIEKTEAGLKITTLSQEWLQKYLEAHPGELQLSARGKDSVFITSPTEDLQKFILKHWKDKDAMGEPSLFVRRGNPATREAK